MKCLLRSLAFAVGVVLSPLAEAQKQSDPAVIARGVELMEKREEDNVRKGALMLAKEDTAEAVAALLEVMQRTERQPAYLAPGHYRDIAWEGLIEIKDHYARRRVEAELKKSKSAWVRQWCAELLGIYGEADFGTTVMKALSDRDDGVVRWSARSLGMMKFEPAKRPLEKLIKKSDPYVRANAIEALCRIDAAKYRPTIEKALRSDKDGGVRCALLGAAAEVYPGEVEAWSTTALEDEGWRPRMQAVDNLGNIKTKTSVDALIDAIDDGRPVVGVRAVTRLQELTGQKMHKQETWEHWWKNVRETFSFPEGRGDAENAGKERSVATYNEIQLVSDHVAFLIDKSKEMEKHLNAKNSSKEDAAQAELEQVLSKLEGRLVFNIFTYNEGVESYEKKSVKLSKKHLKSAPDFVRRQNLYGPKDIWQVLESVLSNPDLDTAYLLSSGEPDVGQYVHWNRVTRHLADMNRFHKITVHSVAYSERQWYRDQLEKISQTTGGEFRWFE